MPLTESTANEFVRRRIHDEGADASNTYADLSDAQINDSIAEALEQYNNDRPKLAIAEFVGNGTSYYLLSSSLPNWEEGSSYIRQVEYPAKYAADNEYPEYLDMFLDVRIHEQLNATVRTLYLFLPNHSPVAAEKVRVFYTVPSAIADVRTSDEKAFLFLASSYAAERMSSKYSKTDAPTFGADIVNYADRGRRWRQLSEEWKGNYYRHIGRTESGDPKASSNWLDWDSAIADRSFFHRARNW